MSEEEAVILSPIGNIRLAARDGRLTRIDLGTKLPLRPPAGGVLALAAREIGEFFAGTRTVFTAALEPEGATPFQRRAWAALAAIPYGLTRTYGDLAKELTTSARAVGGACRRNPLPIIVPCHRVTAADGGLGGYSGDWEKGKALSVKEKLLALEAGRRG